MGKGPGLFSDIGKKARDLLYKDYNYDHKFSLTTRTSTGLSFTSSGFKKGDALLGDISAQLKRDNLTADFKVDTNSNIFTTVTWDEPAPGLKTVIHFRIPDQQSGKVEVQYNHEFAGISSSVGLTPSPLAEFSVAIGSKEVAVGGEVSFDSAAGVVTKYNAGLSFTKPDFTTSLSLNDRADTVKLSYLHTLSPLTNSTVAAEISHSISKSESTFTLGGLYMLDPFTYVKGRINNQGKIAALIQHEWRPKTVITLSGEADTKALDRSTKVGMSLSLKP